MIWCDFTYSLHYWWNKCIFSYSINCVPCFSRQMVLKKGLFYGLFLKGLDCIHILLANVFQYLMSFNKHIYSSSIMLIWDEMGQLPSFLTRLPAKTSRLLNLSRRSLEETSNLSGYNTIYSYKDSYKSLYGLQILQAVMWDIIVSFHITLSVNLWITVSLQNMYISIIIGKWWSRNTNCLHLSWALRRSNSFSCWFKLISNPGCLFSISLHDCIFARKLAT